MVGSGSRLVKRKFVYTMLAVASVFITDAIFAQALFKYRGENGEWIYTDRERVQETPTEIRDLPTGMVEPTVTIYEEIVNGQYRIYARNQYYVPIEFSLKPETLRNLAYPPPGQQLNWVVPPRDQLLLLELAILEDNKSAGAEYQALWLPGDPTSRHTPTVAYRAPFAIARSFEISQTFPIGITHLTPANYYAVDIVMPIGTNIYAARTGTVFEVSSNNFRGGLDPDRDLDAANLIRILHDDGTFSVYAHLNRNTIRVQPGDKVERGDYIADSGNTGFSSGPHLHFAVMLNKGLRLESVPVVFEGPNNSQIVPETGNKLVAY